MPGGRVLMIAHHFPPAGGSGANRALAMASFLSAYGWQPTVVTPGAAWAANRDDGLLAELPPGIGVVRTRSFEAPPTRSRAAAAATGPRGRAMRAAGVLRAVRSQVGHLKRFPDAHVGWVPFALAAARRERFDVAYSSSGPFSSHLVGLLLKLATNKPWVAELRDGWYRWNRAIFPDYPGWRDVLERQLEAQALRRADRVVLVTDRMAEAFRAQYPAIPREHFAVVPNGFDPRQFVPSGGPTHSKGSGAFEVLHSGALYYGRSVANFLQAVQQLAETDPEFGGAFKLTLLGTLDAAAQAELRQTALGDRVSLVGQVDHVASLAAMRQADVLLLVANTTPGAEATVPGKLFEYLAVGKAILAIAPRSSSTRDVLERTGGAYLAAPDEPSAIACALRNAFEAHQRGAGAAAVPNPDEVARFDRRILAGDLARIFDQLAEPSHARRV
jgi:glycosyltransferase involved in cell wall biosynthesis